MSGGRVVKIILIVFVVGIVIAGLKGFDLYQKAFSPNVFTEDGEEMYFFIETGSSYEEVYTNLQKEGVLKSGNKFDWTSERKNYPNHIRPGRYLLKNRMSSNDLVNKLRSGNQSPVKISFNNINTLKKFSERIADQLEFSSEELMILLTDKQLIKEYGFNEYTIPAMFIPNSYEVYWNISPKAFLNRMHSEFDKFWTNSRERKAEKIGMTKVEVITLASIVKKEVMFNDEKRRVAGLYMNRIKGSIRLQADPTLIFAHGDYSINRVLNKHKKLDSPYNTYRNDGLPPGPICLPDIASIDAVLNYESHKYIYMCAKSDFSGYHNFARTLSQHNKNAEAYRRELNKRRIYN